MTNLALTYANDWLEKQLAYEHTQAVRLAKYQ